jgi:CHAP domain-containing protein
MSIQAVIVRIEEIQNGLAPATPAASGGRSFASVLGTTSNVPGTAPTAAPTWTATGGAPAIVQAAEGEVGQAEQPPGSNDSPRIATYRTAVAGAGVGPWCAQFVSWCAKQAGAPLGEAGQGFQSVSAIADWAQRTGRWQPAGSAPQPGDLIVWGGEHVGLVESVDPDGSIHTIEGNSSNAVSKRTYGSDGGGATGYVHLG